MAKIRILPSGIEFEAGEGETVMGAAQARGYYWPTTCGGEGRCTTCACEVVEGANALSPAGRSEEKTLVYERGEASLRAGLRLACQARLTQDATITVKKPGVRRPVGAGA